MGKKISNGICRSISEKWIRYRGYILFNYWEYKHLGQIDIKTRDWKLTGKSYLNLRITENGR
jgi:hypothetical protein